MSQIQVLYAQIKPASTSIQIFGACQNCSTVNQTQKTTVNVASKINVSSNKRVPDVLSAIRTNAAAPQVQYSGNFFTVSTSYGIPSASTSITVTGSNLQGGITVTAANGFEVSVDNINFTNSIAVGAAGSVSATVYIRLSGKVNVGQYNGNFTLATAGAQDQVVNISRGTVVPTQLNVWGKVVKVYGDEFPVTVLFSKGDPGFITNMPGLQNGNTAKSIKFTFSGGRAATDPVGDYSDKVSLSDFQGENGFLASNYDIHYNGTNQMNIVPAPLTITATEVTKAYGTTLSDGPKSDGFSSVGLKNFENIGNVTMHYGAGAEASAAVGTYPLSVIPIGAGGGTFLPGNYDITYQSADLKVLPTGPILHDLGQLYTMQIVYGDGVGSSSAKIRVSGEYLTDNVIVNAPDGFIISLDDRNFGKTVQLSPNASGAIPGATIYIRLMPTAQVKQTYDSNVIFTTAGTSLTAHVVGTVIPAPLTITVINVTKPYGTTLANIPSTSNFTVLGLKNNETVGTIAIKYSDGAQATAAQGFYSGSVIPYNAGGGTFSPDNYTITYLPADLTVGPPAPSISYAGQQVTLQTVYGTASMAQGIDISGSNLTGNIIVTAPSGFQVSNDNNIFNNSVTLSPVGGSASSMVYIRLTSDATAGNHTSNLNASSAGAQDLVIPVIGNVTPAPLVVKAIPVLKIYGEKLVNGSSANFDEIGLKNGETINSVTLNYGEGGNAAAHTGVYDLSITPSGATGGTFNPDNYIIQYVPGAITINKAPLTIKADDLSKAFLKSNPTLTVTYTGFVNNDGPAQIIQQPVISTTAETSSNPGKYPIIVSGAQSDDYIISYIPGELTVFLSSKDIKIYNTFTPNGDGVNDQWIINDLQYYSNCTVDIFNRYGLQIYFSRGYSHPWDGTYKGKPVPTGSYYYVINPNDGTANKFAGYLTVLR
ncbi:MBG domain-containing protein [Mucilaginibacter sp. cycad4]|uniref:MBG domain-containing protein n=1 Tax=Mucilaginibacter sp. cycad4 TaxID=3342096 RepID=UPI002AAA77DD|nr:MBG domain-containing protein [Mucilaginibacter gossypii]WPU99735.1 MBG domain-containing protein [Mucilaginibacter gossypii]